MSEDQCLEYNMNINHGYISRLYVLSVNTLHSATCSRSGFSTACSCYECHRHTTAVGNFCLSTLCTVLYTVSVAAHLPIAAMNAIATPQLWEVCCLSTSYTTLYTVAVASHLPVAAISAIATPQLWEVFFTPTPKLATATIEVLALLIGNSIR